jgi:hypothetical protein
MSSSSVEEFAVGRCNVRIELDGDPLNPRKEYDNVGTMVCWHRRYELGDEQPSEDAGDYLLNLARGVVSGNYPDALLERNRDAILNKHFVKLSLYLYDHSGITMSTGAFSCPWDSGQVGFIYCSLEKAQHEWGTEDSKKRGWDGEASYTLKEDGSKHTLREAAANYLKGEVETYDQYLTGEVYGYVVEAEDMEQDSCWGFFGDISYVKEEATSIAKHHNERMDEADRLAAIAEEKEKQESAYWACRDLVTA